MTRLLRAASLLFALGLSGCASLGSWFGGTKPVSAAAPVQGKPAYELRVDAPGPQRELLLKHLDLARFQHLEGGERLSLTELDRLSAAAPAQARSLLETEGFFNAGVRIERSGDGSAAAPLQLKIAVELGPRTRVESLQLQFDGALAEDAPLGDELREQWSLKAGQPFSQAAWSEAKTQALALARARGFPLARWAESAARIDADANQAHLQLKLDGGPLFRLGELQIEGLKLQTPETVQRLSGFSAGEPYTEQKLLDFQERLLRTQLFDSAVVDILPDAAQAAAVPVRVRLREAPRHQATTGIGYHANSGERVTLEYMHRRPLGLPLRGRGKLDLGRQLSAAELELSSHPQPDMQRNLGSLQWQQDRTTDTQISTWSGRLGRLRETSHDERLLFLELLRSREQSELATINAGAWSLNAQWIRRRVDNSLLPEDGNTALLLLGAGRADSNLLPSGPFARAHLKLNWYRPVGAHWYASLRTELGELFAREQTGLPNKLLFQAGGDDSVRGYAYRSLGPKDAKGDTLGGRVVWTGSAELARPLNLALPSLWGAAFVDAGQAADNWRELHPVLGYGVGLRWRSPVGPLRVDLARGHSTGQWRLHFSVGIAL